MDIYEKNMRVLREFRSSFYEKLVDAIENYREKNLSIVEKTAINGESILEVTRNGTTYRLNSLYNPSHEAMVWSEQFKNDAVENLYVIFGLGNGYFIKALRERVKTNCTILIYEPSFEIFHFAIHHYDFTDIFRDGEIGIVINDVNQPQFRNTLSYLVAWNNLNGQMISSINGYHPMYEHEYMVFLYDISELNTISVMNGNTLSYFGKSIIYNTFENIKYLPESNNIAELTGKIPEDIPAIIVSAGPSLDDNVEELRKAKGKAIIISVDRALDILLKHNIIPDLSVTLDAHKPPRFYDNPITWEIPICFDLRANRNIMCRHTGRKILFGGNVLGNEFYHRMKEKNNTDQPGGSVATAAFTIAKAMGVKNIILVGQDLAYRDGYTHAGGIKLEEGTSESKLVKVKGIDGEELVTGWDMYGYIVWFQDVIKNHKNKIQVIDATEGGALIKGTTIMTLKDAIQTYCKCTFDVFKVLEEITISDTENRQTILSELIEDTIVQLEELYTLSEKAEKLCDCLLANIIEHTGLNNKGLQMTQLLAEINEKMDHMYVSQIVEAYTYGSSSKTMADVNQISQDNIKDQRKTVEMSAKIYSEYKYACKELIEYIHSL